MNVLDILRVALLCAEAMIGFFVLYLLAVAGAAAVATLAQARYARRDNGGKANTPSVAIVIPAHDEETTLGGLLECLSALSYPRERYTVCVVADNCEDRTAAIARAYAGVRVYERRDDIRRGKGYALAWIFEQIAADGLSYDAYLVLDADAVVEPDVLRAFADALGDGAQAVQGRYLALNPRASASAALRWIALALANHVRPLGRYSLGASASITGNGFCLTYALLQAHPWRAFGLAEDYQYYLSLVESGVRVHYAPRAQVLSAMPTSFRQMRTQDVRWESAGAGQTPARVIASRLLLGWLHTGDFRRLEAVIELVTPQLSVFALCDVLFLAASVALWEPVAFVGALGLIVGLALYVSSAFALLRPPVEAYRALLFAPWYAAQKAWIILVVRHRAGETHTWVRTSREV